jgi:hypothetical protein
MPGCHVFNIGRTTATVIEFALGLQKALLVALHHLPHSAVPMATSEHGPMTMAIRTCKLSPALASRASDRGELELVVNGLVADRELVVELSVGGIYGEFLSKDNARHQIDERGEQ